MIHRHIINVQVEILTLFLCMIGSTSKFKDFCETMRQIIVYTLILIAALSILAACGDPQIPAQSTQVATQATNTSTHIPATMAAGQASACHSSLWGKLSTSAGPNILLPPHTYAGLAETFPPDNGWTGYYQRFCTDGDLGIITDFIATHMPQQGWSFGQPPATCICGGMSGWMRPHDGRFVQIDNHPAALGSSIQWGITIYTQG